LLDLTRSRLGSGVPITRATMDLAHVIDDSVEEVKAAHPESVFECNFSGDLRGSWDCGRVSQVIANLLGNAVQHGAAKTTIEVTARGDEKEVVLQVHNQGPAIPAEDLHGLFSPLKRLQAGGNGHTTPTSSLGLGLYISERIVTAHGGTIAVQSSASSGSTFTVRLPR
jgi:signal transduction histidine kinase